MNRTKMSPASAIQLLVIFIDLHGREPAREECRRMNGLPHYQTLQYVCGGLTQALQLARDYLTTGSAAFSGASLAHLSATPCSVRMTTCLRCGRSIVWEGPHVRQCSSCRKHHEDAEDVSGVSWPGMYSVWPRDTEDLIDWT